VFVLELLLPTPLLELLPEPAAPLVALELPTLLFVLELLPAPPL
jgi:hypothetical protein